MGMAGEETSYPNKPRYSFEDRVDSLMTSELGFSHIIPHLIKKLRSGCLLVGHNMWYDVLFFFS